MKRVTCIASGILLTASAAFAQMPAQGAPQKVSLAVGLQRSYDNIKTNLTQAVDKMAEADTSFTPASPVRGFGAQFGHVSNFHYLFCSAAKGEANPNQGQNLEQKTTKADFVKALADSFAYCDPVFSSLTDESAVQLVKQGQNEVARGSVLTNLIAHDNEEYGIITIYLRLKAQVPPSTERQMQGRGGRGGRGQ